MNFTANPYPFIQDASFAYFFGLSEPSLAGIIDLDAEEETIFGDDDTFDYILWHGTRSSFPDRASMAGIRNVAPAAAARDAIERAQGAGRPVHYLPSYRPDTSLLLAGLLGLGFDAVAKGVSVDLVRAVVALREIKGSEEIVEMESALEVTARMHLAAMRASRVGRFEYEVIGEMEGILRGKARRSSYNFIFSKQGEVLHNMTHANRLEAGDLVINDAGATSPLGYASDITRTIPVGGRFDARQREIYDIVLRAQTEAIAVLRPGLPYLDAYKLAARIIAEGMVDLGLFRGNPADLVEDGVHALIFPHGLGHAIGLDVHDMESFGGDHVGYDDTIRRSAQFGLNHLRIGKRLAAGMVVTVEPGIYFIEPLIDQWQSEGRFAGNIDYDRIRTYLGFGGVRIEDDVLITENASRVLGPPIPKLAHEVEAAMSG